MSSRGDEGTDAAEAASTDSYRPLYKYVDIAGLRRILYGAIRFTQPSAFNDPFELLPEIIVPNDAPARQISPSFDILAPRLVSLKDVPETIPKGCGSNDSLSRDIVQHLNQLGVCPTNRQLV